MARSINETVIFEGTENIAAPDINGMVQFWFDVSAFFTLNKNNCYNQFKSFSLLTVADGLKTISAPLMPNIIQFCGWCLP